MNAPEKWYCMKCGHPLITIKLDEPQGESPVCLDCKILYSIHGTGVDGSLFVAGAETLTIPF